MAVLASILLVGCNAEPAGTRIFGLNESDRDVIVASSQHHGSPRVLTPHTWGLLFDEPFELPSGEITVYDGECRQKASLPRTRAINTLHIGSNGDIEFLGQWEGPLPSGIHQAPANPSGDGTLWREATCP
jgi:hypothetical protein